MKLITKFWIAIAVLIVLSPLGLLLPEHFRAGSAWGEWGSDEMQKLVGYVPRGLSKLADLWKAPMPDYAFKGWEERGLAHLSLAYIVSAALGIIAIIIIMWLLGKMFTRDKGKN